MLRFSGPPSADPAALHRALAGAVRADITVGGYLVFAMNPAEDVLDHATLKRVSILRRGRTASTSGVDDLGELIDALRVTEVTDFLCMCTGDFVIEFYDKHDGLIEVVRVDLPSRVESRHWAGAAYLAEPARLVTWLDAHGLESS
ncbi:hypothetical protein FB00_04035 [Cellulosimicrobium funkei]|uniref:Uncharacterized protein n=1 Tax=Cellulosimicrobium funkei TaxID=264251 RepID=A0A0H2KRM2_9MICO|nr:hypothetical protein FB00_04035 [Cellulosimicrobium funkei]